MDTSLVHHHRRILLSAIFATIAVCGSSASTDGARTSPTVTVLSGDNQKGAPGELNRKPFDIAVWNAAGTAPLVDAPVTFTVESGGGLLAANKDAVPSDTLTLKTDQDGTVQALYRQPLGYGIPSQIKASAGPNSLVLNTSTLAFGEVLPDDAHAAGGGGSNSKTIGAGAGGSVIGGFIGGSGSSSGVSSQSSATGPKIAALTVAASQVLLKTPSHNYSVNTSTWAISDY